MIGPWNMEVNAVVPIEILDIRRRFGRRAVLVKTGETTHWLYVKDALNMNVKIHAKSD